MKVVFVCSEDESLGVGYLSSYLKAAGHETFLVFDPRQFNRAFAQNDFLSKIFDIKPECVQRVVNLNPDLICFSVLTANYQWALKMAKAVKEKIKTPIIFGGIHPTSLPEEVLKNPQVDMVCIGEGELALRELVENLNKKDHFDVKNIWFKKNDRIIKNQIRPLIKNLDILSFPDKEMFYEQLPPSYRVNSSIVASRGCYFNCSYCCNNVYHKLYGNKNLFRQRSVTNVIKELEKMKIKFKSKHIYFMDDLFGIDKKWLNNFCVEYKKKISLSFSCLSHPSLVDEGTAVLLKKSGCRLLMLGLQTGSENFRRKIFNRNESNKIVKQAAEACWGAKLNFSIDHILNAPGDSDQIELESARLYNQLRPNIVHCYGLLYFPSAKITNTAIQAGVLGDEAQKLINEGKTSLYPSAVLSSKGENLQKYYRKYSLLLTLIPLFPQKTMEWIIDSGLVRKMISSLPLSLIVVVKIILNIKTGMGLLPLSVLKNELFFFRRFIKIKLGLIS